MNIHDLLNELKGMMLPHDEYIVCGSAPLAIIGLREAHDLDVVVSEQLYVDMMKYVQWINSHGGLVVGNIEFYSFGNDELMDRMSDATLYMNMNMASLRTTMEWKHKVNRDKDKEDIRLILEYLSR